MKNPLAVLKARREDKAIALISDYLAGELSPEQAAAVQRRLERDQEFQDLAAPLMMLSHAARSMRAAEVTQIDMEEGWKGFKAAAMRMNPELGALLPDTLPEEEPVPYLWPAPPTKRLTPKKWVQKQWDRWEAFRDRHIWRARTIVVLIGIGIDATCWGNLLKGEPTVSWRTAEVTNGTASVVPLPEGAHATLAGRTVLKYPAKLDRIVDVEEQLYVRTRHEVTLEGEAYFEMAGTAVRHQLQVHAGDVTVVSLDGAFDVAAYPGRPVVVSVVKGHARVVGPDSTATTLVAGQEVTVTKGVISTPRPAKRSLTWRTGTRVYKQTLMGDVLDDLADWYGMKFVLVPPRVRSETVNLTIDGTTADAALKQVGNATGHLFDRWVWYVLFDY